MSDDLSRKNELDIIELRGEIKLLGQLSKQMTCIICKSQLMEFKKFCGQLVS